MPPSGAAFLQLTCTCVRLFAIMTFTRDYPLLRANLSSCTSGDASHPSSPRNETTLQSRVDSPGGLGDLTHRARFDYLPEVRRRPEGVPTDGAEPSGEAPRGALRELAAGRLRDPGLDEALAHLASKWLPDGRWNLDHTNGDFILEPRRKPSKMITFLAQRVAERVGGRWRLRIEGA